MISPFLVFFQPTTVRDFLVAKKECLTSVFEREVEAITKANGQMNLQLSNLKYFARPHVYGDRRHLLMMDRSSPLDCEHGRDHREEFQSQRASPSFRFRQLHREYLLLLS